MPQDSDMEGEQATPTKHTSVFVPETPSPVFSRFKGSKRKPGSPSPKKYWFENLNGKVGAETKKNGTVETLDYLDTNKRLAAFEKLRKVRERKASKSECASSPKGKRYDRSRAFSMWPSESDTSSDSDSEKLLTFLHRDNGQRKAGSSSGGVSKGSSSTHQANLTNGLSSRSVIDEPSPSVDSSLNPKLIPLRERLKGGLFGKLSGTKSDNNSTGKLSIPSTSTKPSSIPTASSTLPSNYTHRLSSGSDFMSARQMLENDDFPASSGTSEKKDEKRVTVAHTFEAKFEGNSKDSSSGNNRHRKRRERDEDRNHAYSSHHGSEVNSRTLHSNTRGTSSERNTELPAQNFYSKSHFKKRRFMSPAKTVTKSSSDAEGGAKKKKQPARQPTNNAASTGTGAAGITIDIDSDDDDDAIVVVNQLETDESMARRLQEEMDREFAMNLAQTHSPAHTQSHAHHNHAHHSHSHMHVHAHNHARTRGRSRREVLPPGFEVYDDSEEESPAQNFTAFMSVDGWGPGPFAFLRSHFSLLSGAGSDGWTSPRSRRRTTRRAAHGRMGRRNALVVNSPGANGEDYEALLNLAEHIGDVKPKGLTKTQINCLPLTKFVPSTGESTQNQECLICMCDFESGESIRILTCFHNFHETCIDKWLKGNATCPICRVEVQLQ